MRKGMILFTAILVEHFILTFLVPKLTGNFSHWDWRPLTMAVYRLLARPLQKCSKWLAHLGKLCLLGSGKWVKYIHFFKDEETKIWKDWPNHSSGYILSSTSSRELRRPFSGLEWPFWIVTFLVVNHFVWASHSDLNPGFTLTSSCKKELRYFVFIKINFHVIKAISYIWKS